MRTFGMYAGIAGLELSAAAAGCHVVGFCEQDSYCQGILRRHYPGVPIWEHDTQVTRASLEEAGILPIDLVCGGPPCQPTSAAGKRAGTGDPRWRWGEFLRVCDELRPRWITAENPAGLLSLHGGAAFAGILRQLDEMGYRAGWGCYGADACGAPHRRDRVFLVARRRDAGAGSAGVADAAREREAG